MKKKTTDRIIGLSAILISFLTLVIFIYQTNIVHKQSRLSVTPRLGFNTQFISYNDSLVTYTCILENKGIGPAIVQSAKIELNGKKYSLDMDDFFSTMYPKLQNLGVFIDLSNINLGSTLSSNETKKIFSFQFNNINSQKILSYLKMKDGNDLPFKIEIIYNSIYEDEKWKIDSKENTNPIKLA